jgi:hypothetical protein
MHKVIQIRQTIRSILLGTLITSIFLTYSWALDAEREGAIYGDPEGLARVTALESELHNMQIRSDHPRIFLNSDNLNKYRQRVQAGHPSWATVQASADSGDMVSAAFCYQMLKISNPTAAQNYANIAINAIKSTSASQWSADQRTRDKKVALMALAFDWIYDAASSSDKTTIINSIGNLANISGRAQWIRAGSKEQGETFHREEWIFWAWRAWPEIALANHYTDADFCYKSRWNYDWYWGDAARMYAYAADGTPFEGYYTGADGVSWLLPLKTATGINLVDGQNYPWCQNVVYQNLYRFDLGMGREIFHHGVNRADGGLESYTTPDTWKRREFLGQTFPLAAETDPYAQWILKNVLGRASSWLMTNEYYSTMAEIVSIANILFYDPNSTATDPKTATYSELPFARLFPAGNEVYMRSGWTGDAACAGFRVSPAYTKTSHGDFDVNTFILYRKGNLAPDTGVYDTTDTPSQVNYINYQKNTVAHNDILIIDPNSPDEPRKLSNSVDPGGTDLVSTRTFGLDYGHGLDTIFLHSPDAHWGDITKFETTPDYDYAVGEAAKAYGTRLSEYVRSIVFIRKDTRAYFVVFDRVEATNQNFQKKWLLHLVAEPTVNGNKVSEQVAGHIDTYDGDLTSSTNAFANAALYCKTLLPQQHLIRRIGGDGYEFYVEGTNPKNYPVEQQNKDAEPAWSGGPWQEWGTWRIEITPTAPALKDYFLNVMYLCDTGDTMPTTVRIDATSGNMVGVHIQDATKPWVVMFSKTATPVSSLSYQVNSVGLSKHLLSDIKKQTNYEIRQNGSLIQTKQSSDQGTLFFEVTLTGNDTFNITEAGSADTTAPATTSGSGGRRGGGGRCLIATAVYGSSMAKEVVLLTTFRDKYLLTNKLGRVLVKLYYKVSPIAAKYIEKRAWARNVTREILRPVIWFVRKTSGSK